MYGWVFTFWSFTWPSCAVISKNLSGSSMKKIAVKGTSCWPIRTLPCILPMPVCSRSVWRYPSQLIVSSVILSLSLALPHPLRSPLWFFLSPKVKLRASALWSLSTPFPFCPSTLPPAPYATYASSLHNLCFSWARPSSVSPHTGKFPTGCHTLRFSCFSVWSLRVTGYSSV